MAEGLKSRWSRCAYCGSGDGELEGLECRWFAGVLEEETEREDEELGDEAAGTPRFFRSRIVSKQSGSKVFSIGMFKALTRSGKKQEEEVYR